MNDGIEFESRFPGTSPRRSERATRPGGDARRVLRYSKILYILIFIIICTNFTEVPASDSREIIDNILNRDADPVRAGPDATGARGTLQAPRGDARRTLFRRVLVVALQPGTTTRDVTVRF